MSAGDPTPTQVRNPSIIDTANVQRMACHNGFPPLTVIMVVRNHLVLFEVRLEIALRRGVDGH